MAATVGTFEAKTHLSELLDRVAKGEEITITRHGNPVARLVPVTQRDQRRIDEAIARLKLFHKGRILGDDLSIRDLIDEGRKW